MNDVYIYRVPLPSKTKGVTVIKDSNYVVLINNLLCPETQDRALHHELEHIGYDHLYDDCKDIVQCEAEASAD